MVRLRQGGRWATVLGLGLLVAAWSGDASADTDAFLSVCLATKSPALLAQPVGFDVGGTPVAVQYDPNNPPNCSSQVPESSSAPVTVTVTVPAGAVLVSVTAVQGGFPGPAAISWGGGASAQLTLSPGASSVQFDLEPQGPPDGSLAVGGGGSADAGATQTITATVSPAGSPLDAGFFTATASISADTAGAQFVGDRSCTYTRTAPSCRVQVTAAVAGITTVHVTTSFTVAGTPFARGQDVSIVWVKNPGQLEICTAPDDVGTHQFTVTIAPGVTRSQTIPGGSCGFPLQLNPGEYTISETPSPAFRVTNVTATRPDTSSALVAADLGSGTATVAVTAFSLGGETLVSFTHGPPGELVKICAGSAALPLQGRSVTFDVGAGSVSFATGAIGNDGYTSCTNAGGFAVGSIVTVSERVPTGVNAVGGASRDVTIAPGVNEVDFDNEPLPGATPPDASISLSPLSTSDPAQTTRALTISVAGVGAAIDGGDFFVAVRIIADTAGTSSDLGCTYTAATPECTVTISSAGTGATTIRATTTVSVGGVLLTRSTGSAPNANAGGSGDAAEVWGTPLDQTTDDDVPAGGTLSTANPPTAADPIQSSVTSPNPGSITIVEQPLGDEPAPGFSFANVQTVINAPPATVEDPLVLDFKLDGVSPGALVVFRNGSPVGDCDTPTIAHPDPCVVSKTAFGTSGAEAVVRSSHASVWNFGSPAPPIVVVPPNVVAEATSRAGAVVSYSATASDAVDGLIAARCSPASGTRFPVGTTTVSCSATDSGGRTGQATFTVLVHDTTAPAIAVPADITKSGTGTTTRVTYSVSFSDAVGVTSSGCAPRSGSGFPPGTTTVTCTASDAAGNTATASFHVTVSGVDKTPPVITVPANMTVNATSPAGATVSFDVSAVDLVDGAVAVTCAPASGSLFKIGTTTVACSAVDASGNKATKSFKVKVLGAGEQLEALKALVAQAHGVPGPTRSLLLADLGKAGGPDKAKACQALAQFAADVGAAPAGAIDAGDATGWLTSAARISAVRGCS